MERKETSPKVIRGCTPQQHFKVTRIEILFSPRAALGTGHQINWLLNHGSYHATTITWINAIQSLLPPLMLPMSLLVDVKMGKFMKPGKVVLVLAGPGWRLLQTQNCQLLQSHHWPLVAFPCSSSCHAARYQGFNRVDNCKNLHPQSPLWVSPWTKLSSSRMSLKSQLRNGGPDG